MKTQIPVETVIVIPCFNEEKRLNIPAFLSFIRAKQNINFLFVNDGSTDRTLQILQNLCTELPDRMDVFSLEKNSGKAEAVRQGVLEALKTSAQFVGYWDSDLATPLDIIPEFHKVLTQQPNLEMILGSRIKLLGHSIERKAGRHYLGRIAATLSSWVLRIPVYDTQCGAKLFRVSDNLISIFQSPFISGWIFDIELIARFILRYRNTDETPVERIFYEYPLQKWQDVDGSKIKLSSYFTSLLDLMRIHFKYMRK